MLYDDVDMRFRRTGMCACTRGCRAVEVARMMGHIQELDSAWSCVFCCRRTLCADRGQGKPQSSARLVFADMSSGRCCDCSTGRHLSKLFGLGFSNRDVCLKQSILFGFLTS